MNAPVKKQPNAHAISMTPVAVYLNLEEVYSVIILYSNMLEVFPENPKMKKAIKSIVPFLANINNITPIKFESQVTYMNTTLRIEITLKTPIPITHPYAILDYI